MPPKKKKHTPRNNNVPNAKTTHKYSDTAQANTTLLPPQAKKVPIELLQHLLNIFNDALYSHSGQNFSDLIQQVKQYLFNRDFANAFGRNEFLEVYAARWSPSRALAYTNVFCSLPVLAGCLSSASSDGLNPCTPVDGPPILVHDAKGRQGKVGHLVCIGAGGGAEIVALGGFLKDLEETSSVQQTAPGDSSSSGDWSPPIRFEVTAVDVADWSAIVSRLHSAITTAPPLSRYASAETKTANCPLVDASTYTVRFVQQNVLNMELADLATTFANVSLVTLMFTLNELYSTSISATTNLLLSLTMFLSPGALLLVVDSPGSYSTIELRSSSSSKDGSDPKTYPMRWLLDHTLLESAAVGSSKNASAGGDQWEKLDSRDSEWFRLPEGLIYPIKLEDMRYQVHLYRRL